MHIRDGSTHHGAAAAIAASHILRERFARTVLLLAAAIHLVPLAGIAGAPVLQQLYAVGVADPALLLLLQHRAVLFGLFGAGLAAAALTRRALGAALICALISTVSFVLLALPLAELAPALQRVVVIDALLSLLLVAALIARRSDR